MELSQALKNNFVFRGLPPSVINMLAAYADVRTLSGGETIIRQFDRSQDIIVIMDGEAVTRNFVGDVVARFGPGSVVGEMALVDGAPRSASVLTVGPTQIAVISAECIKNLIEIDPAFGQTLYQNVAKILTRRLRTMNENAGLPALATAGR